MRNSEAATKLIATADKLLEVAALLETNDDVELENLETLITPLDEAVDKLVEATADFAEDADTSSDE